jgi:hypothetical protein
MWTRIRNHADQDPQPFFCDFELKISTPYFCAYRYLFAQLFHKSGSCSLEIVQLLRAVNFYYIPACQCLPYTGTSNKLEKSDLVEIQLLTSVQVWIRIPAFQFNPDPDPAPLQNENLRPLVYRPSMAPFRASMPPL